MYTNYPGDCGSHLATDQPYKSGDVVSKIEDYQITSKPTYQTIQVGRDLHLKELGITPYMNILPTKYRYRYLFTHDTCRA